MKKIVGLLVVSFVLFGCASITVPTEFDPTATPFEGEWKAINIEERYILTYIFTGNRWEFKQDYLDDNKNDVYLTGLFNYDNKKVLYSNEKGKGTQGKMLFSFQSENRTWSQGYELRGFFLHLQVNGILIKQPYGDLVNSYLIKEKKVSDIVSNREELASIQGSWRAYNRQATYTFSGDQFTLTATGKRPITGTIKIRDNILYFIISDEQFGILYLDFLPKNNIFLNDLKGHPDLWWGQFIKQ